MDFVGQLIQMDLRAVPADWVGSFDRLEVWRSRTGPSGPYEELTAADWSPARLPVGVVGDEPIPAIPGREVLAVGETFEALLDETKSVSITFTGTNPLTLGELASQVNADSQVLLRSFVASDGRLVVETMEPGGRVILRIVPTNAAVLMSLPTTEPECVAYGKDARLNLRTDTEIYSFTDHHGSLDCYYKTRFRHAATGEVSEFSLPFSAASGTRLDSEELVLGILDIVDSAGKPIANREVSVNNKFMGQVVNGKLITGTPRSALTDNNGHVEFLLIRGLDVTVSVAGTTLVRDVHVPTDPSLDSFSLFDAGVGHDDLFTVRVPNIDYAVRRSL